MTESYTVCRFREFPVYRDLRALRKDIKQLTKERFPSEEQFVLRPQLWRALDSSILNVAEGADRYSDKDFSHFLNTALTSVHEVVACLDCAFDDGYIDKEEHQALLLRCENVLRQLKAFLAKVRRDNY